MVYLIVRGTESILFDNLFTYCDLPTKSNGYKLQQLLSPQYQKVSQRIINEWNNLHAYIESTVLNL